MKKLIPLILTLCILLSACNATNTQNMAPDIYDDSDHDWSYSNQEDWRPVTGYRQSPIQIETEDALPMENSGGLLLHYNRGALYMEDNGHTLQAGIGGTAVLNNRPFAPVQIHFHAPGEHVVNDVRFPLEAHIVHQAQDGVVAMVAILFAEGEENMAFDNLLQPLKEKGDAYEESLDFIDLNRLLPSDRSYYHYIGSLTTPPLTEGVEWYILSEPMELSREQLAAFEKYYSGDYRETQPLNDRVVLYYNADR